MKLYSLVTDGKGGVGKSTIAALLAQMLTDRFGRDAIAILDSDLSNSVMASVFSPDRVRMVNLTTPQAPAFLVRPARDGGCDAVVLDGGAREEILVKRILRDVLIPELQRARIPLVVFRPVTTSSFVQANLAAFVEEFQPLEVKVVLVRIEAMGRTAEHFAAWAGSQTRRGLLARPGVTEIVMDDLDAALADDAVAFNLSFGEIAQGDFSRVEPANLEAAQATFNPDIQLHFALWMARHVQRLEQALDTVGVRL